MKRFVFILLTFLWSWGFFLTAAAGSNGWLTFTVSPELLIVAGAFGPSLSAFAVAWGIGGRSEAAPLLRRGLLFRFSPFVYLFVAITPVVTSGISYFVAGGRSPAFEALLPVLFLLFLFLGGSLGEEFGWRGLLLPEMLREERPLAAALQIGAVWALWHLPLFYVKGTSQYLTPFPLYFLFVLALSVQYVWVFLRTGGSVLACLLFHTFVNITVRIFPFESDEAVVRRLVVDVFLNVAIAVILVAFDRRLLKLDQ